MDVLHLTKLECAKRQLLVAVDLYFQHEDPVSVHTLVCAAYNVLRDLTIAKNAEPMHAKQVYANAPGKVGLRELNEAENFFKHADRDPDESHAFYPILTEPLLMDACRQYALLSGEHVGEFIAYQLWFMCQKPDEFDIPEDMQEFAKAGETLFKSNDREGFKKLSHQFAMSRGMRKPDQPNAPQSVN